ncbi:MAG: ATP-dependent Clp protease adaptor ClpS [Bacteroidales bacterium]
MTDKKLNKDFKLKEKKENLATIILHNDDFNTFDFVIDSLIELCGHDEVQAEQCAFIVHYKGKCDVLNGSFSELIDIYEEMKVRELTVTLNN